MQIYGTNSLHGPQSIGAPHINRGASSSGVSQSGQIQDQLDISSAGQLLDKIGQLPEMRNDRVAQLRAAIADGSYETDDKLSAALNRMLDEIG